MTYILSICLCALLVFAVFRVVSIKKIIRHDQALFPFCQLRRDIIRFLRENVIEDSGALSMDEYVSVRRLLDMVNVTIRNYNQHKTLMFNLRKIVAYLRQYRRTLKKAMPLNLTDNSEIQEFHARFALCLAKAFLTYTPLIRSELALRVLVWAGLATSERLRSDVVEIAEQVRVAARGGNMSGATT